jgi:dTDP-4-amino-4,6-dideoxygalactose transaminase
MQNKIWLSPFHMSGNELSFIEDALKKNWVTSMVNNIDEFEESLSKFLNSE